MRYLGRRLPVTLLVWMGTELFGCGQPHHPPPVELSAPSTPPPLPSGVAPFTATAYSGGGITASGTRVKPGVLAADPAVLPLGSRVRVHGAGEYSGEYVVADTGGKIRGRKIDIYMPHKAHAKRFGKRTVKVEVVQYGPRRVDATRAHRAAARRAGHHRHRPHPQERPAARADQAAPSAAD